MEDSEHQAVEKEFAGLLYGDKGTGKTTAAMALAQKLRGEGQILFVDSAEGFASLDSPKFSALKQATHRIRVDDPRELMPLSKALRGRVKGYEPFTVVVLDEYSSWWTDTLHSFAREKAGVTEDEELPEIDWTWYGPPQQAMLNVFKNFHKTVGLHVIVVAHEQGRAVKGDSSGNQRITPLLGTKLSGSIGQLSHVVGRFEARKVGDKYSREVQALPTRYVDAKNRMDLPVKLDVVEFVKQAAAWTLGGGAEQNYLAIEPQGVEDEPQEDEDFEISAEADDPDEQ